MAGSQNIDLTNAGLNPQNKRDGKSLCTQEINNCICSRKDTSQSSKLGQKGERKMPELLGYLYILNGFSN